MIWNEDIFIQICNYLLEVHILVKLEQLSTNHKTLIRTNDQWPFEIEITHPKLIDFVVRNYNFKCYSLIASRLTDDIIDKLKNCHTLNLSNTKITDKFVCKLGNCHTLNLSNTKITDESVCKLKNCHTLNLSNTKITDKSVCKLKNCYLLYINCNINISIAAKLRLRLYRVLVYHVDKNLNSTILHE
jgi:hypothetical protein